MKILITGAGGMLGSDLAEVLSVQFPTVGIGRRLAPHLRIPYHPFDLADADQTLATVDQERPDIIFHTAAMTQVDLCESKRREAMQLNVELLIPLVTAANRAGALLIFFSTDYVFNGEKVGEYEEKDAPRPINFYGETKFLAETHIHNTAKNYLIFRVSWLYGIHGLSFPRTMLEKGSTIKRFDIVNDQIGRPTYTRDLANGFLKLLVENPKSMGQYNREIFHLANEGATHWADYAAFIFQQAGYRDVEVRPIASEAFQRPARRPKNSVLSLKKSREKLGLHLRPWQEATAEFIQVFRTQKGNRVLHESP